MLKVRFLRRRRCIKCGSKDLGRSGWTLLVKKYNCYHCQKTFYGIKILGLRISFDGI